MRSRLCWTYPPLTCGRGGRDGPSVTKASCASWRGGGRREDFHPPGPALRSRSHGSADQRDCVLVDMQALWPEVVCWLCRLAVDDLVLPELLAGEAAKGDRVHPNPAAGGEIDAGATDG